MTPERVLVRLNGPHNYVWYCPCCKRGNLLWETSLAGALLAVRMHLRESHKTASKPSVSRLETL